MLRKLKTLLFHREFHKEKTFLFSMEKLKALKKFLAGIAKSSYTNY